MHLPRKVKNSFSLEVKKPKRSEGWAKLQAWNKKWNRILGIIFGIMCFGLVFAIVTVNIVSTNDSELKREYEGVTDSSISLKPMESIKQPCELDDCSIYCDDGVFEDININVQSAVEVFQVNSSCSPDGPFKLILTNYDQIENNTIPMNWFTLNIPIEEIQIINCKVDIIEDGAFDIPAFATVSTLKMQTVPVQRFTQNIFKGLKSIEYIHLDDMDVEADKGCMAPIAANINTILISRFKNLLALENITGDVPLAATLVDLRSNSFGDLISSRMFKGLMKVQSLFLSSSLVCSLPKDTFRTIRDVVMLIDLRTNCLSNLTDGIFDGILGRDGVHIYLAGNQFVCDCGIQPLRNFLLNSSDLFVDDARCESPLELEDVLVKNISGSVCSDEESESPQTSVTAEPTTEASTINPPVAPFIKLECIDTHDDPTIPDVSVVKARTSDFKIIEESSQKVFVQFNVLCPGTMLVWFFNSTVFTNMSLDIELGTYYGCAINFQSTIEVTGLYYNEHYIFCLLRPKTELSPFDCIPYMLERREMVWLSMDDKRAVFAIFITSLLSSLAFGAFIMYLGFRLVPYLKMKHNERKKSQVSEYEDVEYSETVNYISPTPPRHSIYSLARRSIVSENSMGSGRSYVSAVRPSPFEIMSWRMENNRRKSQLVQSDNVVYLERLPHEPPPLPPHPHRRSDFSMMSSSTQSTSSSNEPLCSISYHIDRGHSYDKSYA